MIFSESQPSSGRNQIQIEMQLQKFKHISFENMTSGPNTHRS